MKITIISSNDARFSNKFLNIFKFFCSILSKLRIYTTYNIGGHYGVTRSILFGLKDIKGIKYNYNPLSQNSISEIVILLSGVEKLAELISLKKEKKIQKLIVGPNVITRSIDYNSIIANSNIDIIVVPSKWVEDFYKMETPSLESKKFIIWAAGVNHIFFSPSKRSSKKINHTLIYIKNGDLNLLGPIKHFLLSIGIEVTEIFYGKYSIVEYKKLLNRVHSMIFFSKSESQGLALFESWSMDVPTFVFENNQTINIAGGDLSDYSSAPYLSNSTGAYFNTLDNFKVSFNRFYFGDIKYSPRDFVVKNFTDLMSTKYLLDKILD